MYEQEHRIPRSVRRLALGLAMGFLLVLLGVFNTIGYHVYLIDEVAVDRTYASQGYLLGTVRIDMVFNPILYPFYWLKSLNRINGTFFLVYYADGFGGEGQPGGARFPWREEGRYEGYLSSFTTWGFFPNMGILLAAAILIEFAHAKAVYIALFTGILGFTFAVLYGLIVSVIIGGGLAFYFKFRVSRDNAILRFWHSLWE